MSSTKVRHDRRSFIGYGTLATAGALVGGPWNSLFAQDIRGVAASGVVQTTGGRARGVVYDRINAFYGLPYGTSTAGANRFMPPAKPQPWTGVRDALEYGPRSPQGPSALIPEDAAEDRREPAGEDCLRVNVWTPALGGGRRPVMVWLHGGGYGQALKDDYVPAEFRSHDNWGPQVIPEGYYFVMGDHRNNSSDSRHWGLVPKKYIVGKVKVRWWPIQGVRIF